jgi:hypothetical protein
LDTRRLCRGKVLHLELRGVAAQPCLWLRAVLGGGVLPESSASLRPQANEHRLPPDALKCRFFSL